MKHPRSPRAVLITVVASGALMTFGTSLSLAAPKPAPSASIVTLPVVSAPLAPSARSSVSATAPSASAKAAVSAAPSVSSTMSTAAAARTVTIGAPRLLRGAALPSGIVDQLTRLQGDLERCFDAAVKATDDGESSVDMRLEYVGPGVVNAATVSASRGASAGLRTCVLTVFEGKRLGAAGPAPVVVDVSVAFDRTLPETHVRPVSACGDTCEGEISYDLRDEVQAHANAAAKCFRKKASPGEPATMEAGRIEVFVRIAGDGSVCGAATAGDSFGRPSLSTCLIDAMSFAYKTKPGACVDMQVPLTFKGN